MEWNELKTLHNLTAILSGTICITNCNDGAHNQTPTEKLEEYDDKRMDQTWLVEKAIFGFLK